MCMLTYLPSGIQPDIQSLGNGAVHNDHGHGYGIVADDHIITGRSMQATALIDEFAALRQLHPDGPALFHSRFATHGPINETNNHPFPVGGDDRTVLAHNGILPREAQPGKGDPRSDTRIAADDIFSSKRFASFDRPQTRRRIEGWLGTFNKIVILTVNPRYPEHGYLFNEQAGVWDNKIWYSNHDYLDLHPGHAAWWGLDEGCVYCGIADAIDPDTCLCLACGACPVCGADERRCAPSCGRLLLIDPCDNCGDDIQYCLCPLPSGHLTA